MEEAKRLERRSMIPSEQATRHVEQLILGTLSVEEL